MIIKELYITEFGCIKNRKIDFFEKNGVNIIFGENESGKSTVFLFIKFIFYGIPRKTQNNNERERALSWSGGVASGSLTLEYKNKEYRIERTFSERARERVTVVDLDSGMPMSFERTPGEYFLGVPREVFESTACTGQMRSAEINGEKTAQSLSNMLSAADESVDTHSILKELDNIRVSYMHKNQKGGSLFDDESKIKSYRMKLEEAKNATLAIEGKEEAFEKVKAQYDAVKLELEEKDALVSQFDKIALLKRFEELREKEARVPSIAERKECFARENLKTEFFPTRKHVAELSTASEELAVSKERLEAREREKNALSVSFDNDLAELGALAEENGGAREMLEPYQKEKTKVARFKNIGIACIATALIGAFGAIAGFFALGIIATVIFACCSILIFAVSVAILIWSAKLSKKIKDDIEALARSFGATTENFEKRVDEALGHLALKREYIAENAKLSAELDVAKESFDRAKLNAVEMIARTLANEADVDSADLDAEAERLSHFLDEYEGIVREEEAFLHILESEKNLLKRYDEEILRSEITVDIDSATPEAVALAQRGRSYLVSQKNAFENKISLLQNELISLRIKAVDPLPVADSLAELEKKVERDRAFFDALVLAMDTIEKARVNMRGNVTPAISKTASELLSRVSAQKYNVLRTNSTLGVTVDADGFGVGADLLSGGTKDLAYLSLRLALIMKIYENEYPPVIFDESFCQLDETRLTRVLELLSTLCDEGIQILIFTSHKREEDACKRLNCKYKFIEM